MHAEPRGNLQLAVHDHLLQFGPSHFRALHAALNRLHPTTQAALSGVLNRLKKKGAIEPVARSVYRLKPTIEYPRSLIVKATLDHLEQSYGPELSFELAVRGWTQ